MQAQAQNLQNIDSINAFCADLEAYLKTGVLPVKATTWNGVQTFHVSRPVIFVAPCGELKVKGKIRQAPKEFDHMIGQEHSLILAL